MARHRQHNWGQAFQGFSDISNTIMQSLLQQRNQKAMSDQSLANQKSLVDYGFTAKDQNEQAKPLAERMGPMYSDIAKTTDQAALPGQTDVVNYFKTLGNDGSRAMPPGAAGKMLGVTMEQNATPDGGLPSRSLQQNSDPALQSALDQRKDKLTQLDLADEQKLNQNAANAQNTAYSSGVGTEMAAKENFGSSLGRKMVEANSLGGIDNANRLSLEKSLSPIEISRAGKMAGATAAAQFPYSAPHFFSDKTTGDERGFRFGPSGASEVNLPSGLTSNTFHEPAGIQARKIAAQNAITSIGTARQLLDAVDSQGLLGPIMSRYNKLVGSGLKSEDAIAAINPKDIISSPDQAALLNDFLSTFGYLSSQAAVAHGGARGGGSVQMSKVFERLMNGMGDKSATVGQLNALERLMQTYAMNPDSPPELDLKQYGLNPDAPTGAASPLPPGLTSVLSR